MNSQQIRGGRERISEVEDRLVEITDVEKNKEKRMKRNEESLRELWDNLKGNLKHTNVCIIVVSKGEDRKWQRKIFEEITAENFPNVGKEPLTQIQEAQ